MCKVSQLCSFCRVTPTQLTGTAHGGLRRQWVAATAAEALDEETAEALRGEAEMARIAGAHQGGLRGDRRPDEAHGAHGGAVRRGIGVAAEDEAATPTVSLRPSIGQRVCPNQQCRSPLRCVQHL